MPKERYRDQAPPSQDGERFTGTINKLVSDKGFGFIVDKGGIEYFFHKSALREGGWEFLQARQPVSFIIRANPKGPRAEDVLLEAEV